MDANFCWYLMLEPDAVNVTNSRWGLSYTPHAIKGMKEPEKYTAEIKQLFDTAFEEDKEMVARVQDGANFAAAEPGHLHSSLEVYVDEFRQYIDRMLETEPVEATAGRSRSEELARQWATRV